VKGCRVAIALCLAAASVACEGRARPFAMWRAVEPMTAQVDCADLQVWVCKSGKEGVGLTVALRTLDPQATTACRVEVVRAALSVLGASYAPTHLPPAPELRPGASVFFYLPFPFDNNSAWNDGARHATVTLEIETRGAAPRRTTLEWPLEQSAPEGVW
jgi:hypothetical protein